MVTWSQMGMSQKFYGTSECYILTLGHTAMFLTGKKNQKLKAKHSHTSTLAAFHSLTPCTVSLMWDKTWTWTHGHMVTDGHVRKIL